MTTEVRTTCQICEHFKHSLPESRLMCLKGYFKVPLWALTTVEVLAQTCPDYEMVKLN